MASEASPIPEGTIVADKYRVEGVLQRGGMGVVLRARHRTLDTPVAVKILTTESVGSHDTAGRFLREARAAAGLHSEYVCRVTDYGSLDDGRPFMVMELLEGEDLGAAMRRGMPVEEVVDAVLQACAGLAEAHAAGIVHRDLKPSNLFRASRPDGTTCTKVLDFGVSKVLTAEAGASMETSAHEMLGTPFYMSPEQVRSARHVDARTDIWSLGVVLHEALGGALPFAGTSIGEVFAAILEKSPPPLRSVPPELANIVRACLAKDPDARPRSVAELARRLAPFGTFEGTVAAQRAQRTPTSVRPPSSARESFAEMPTFDLGATTAAPPAHATPLASAPASRPPVPSVVPPSTPPTSRAPPPPSPAADVPPGMIGSVAEASRLLLSRGFTRSSISDALGILGRGARVDRVYVFEDGVDPTTGERVSSQRFEWVGPGIVPQIDAPACQNMPYAIFGVARRAALARGESVAVDTRDVEPGPLRSILQAQDVRSMLLCPIVQGGKTWGFVGFDDCHVERVWPAAEVAALRSFARAMTASLQHASTTGALTRARGALRSLL